MPKKITRAMVIGIQKGLSTQSHDHAICPVNLSVIKISPRIPKIGNSTETFLEFDTIIS
jgi:hypothetical protein